MSILDRFRGAFFRNNSNLGVIDLEPEEKSSRASRPIHEDTSSPLDFFQGSPGFGDLGLRGDESYERLLQKYTGHLWFYIVVAKISQAVAQVNWRVIDRRHRGTPDETVKGTAMGLLDLLERPNPWMSQSEFKEKLAMHLLITGNAFIELAEIDDRGRPHELYLLNPKNVQVAPDPIDFVAGYRYIVNRTIIRYTPEEICHIKIPDPRGESHYGLSPATAARLDMMLEDQTLDWNLSFFKNATWPSGIIVSKEGLSEDEFIRAKRELKRNYEGSSKAGKLILLTGGLDWKQTTPNPRDLEYLNLLRHIRGNVLSLYGVPPSIAGVFEFENSNTRSSGVREQHIQFWSQTVQPMTIRLLDCINHEITKLFSNNFEIIPDVSKIPALRETEEQAFLRSRALNMLVSSGWSINRATQLLYPDQPTFDWGDDPPPVIATVGKPNNTGNRPVDNSDNEISDETQE